MIITINNLKYDISEFLNEHPGGKHVFIDGADMTMQFNKVGHSKEAIKLLDKYLINKKDNTKEVNDEKDNTKEVNDENVILNTSFINFLKIKFKTNNISRLFTHEDKSNIHKILGTIVLLNSLYLFVDLIYSGFDGNITLRKIDSTYMILLWFHLLIIITSFLFELPTNYNKIKPVMSKEYRLLVAVFSCRSLLIATIFYFFGKNKFTQISCILVTILTTYLADIINKYYKDQNDNLGAKINSYPFWLECSNSLKQIIIFSYSFGSIFFTTMCINNFTTIPLHHYVVFALQFTAFLYTLSKKNIISTRQWHIIYLIEVYGALFLFLKFLYNNISTLPIVILFFILRTHLNMNKYFIFIFYSLSTLFYNYIDKTNTNNIFFVIFTICYYLFFLFNDLIFDKPRKSQHDIVLNNTTINNILNIHQIDIKLYSDNSKFYYGQYYNLYANEEKRPYTPIYMNEDVLSFIIKDYGNETISHKICKFFVKNKAIVISGPFGNKYYNKEKDELTIDNSALLNSNILMFCCGTGITPFYSILSNLNYATKYTFKLFASFKSKKETFLIKNLKNLKNNKINTKLFLSSKNKLNEKNVVKILMKNHSSTILICGTQDYNNFILETVNNFNTKTQQNIACYTW